MKASQIGLLILVLISILLLEASGTPQDGCADMPEQAYSPYNLPLDELIRIPPGNDTCRGVGVAERAAAADPQSAEAQYQLGIALFCEGHIDTWQQSAAAFQRATELNPSFAEAYCRLGELHHLTHMYALNYAHPPEEIAAFKTAIQIRPDYAAPYVGLGDTYLIGSEGKVDDPKKAEGMYLIAIQADPTYIPAYEALAGSYLFQEREDETLTTYRKILMLDLNRASTYAALYNFCNYKNCDKVMDILNEAIALEPDNPWAYRFLGMAYYHQSRYEEAAASYKQLIRLAPAYAEAHYELGSLYLMLGDKQAAQREQRVLVRLARKAPLTSRSQPHYQRRAKELEDEIETGKIVFSHYGSCTG